MTIVSGVVVLVVVLVGARAQKQQKPRTRKQGADVGCMRHA
jgi:hypothetical protein